MTRTSSPRHLFLRQAPQYLYHFNFEIARIEIELFFQLFEAKSLSPA